MLDIQEVYLTARPILEGQLAGISHLDENELADACHELCLFYRAAGIAALLVDYGVNEFHHMLMRSAYTRVAMLKRLSDPNGASARFCKTSRTEGLFDALAVGRSDLAKAIAELSPTKRFEKYEYEDDFSYALFMNQLAMGASRSDLAETAAALEVALQGADPRRFNVCMALLSCEQDSFDDAFEELLALRRDEILALEKSGARHEYEFAAAKYIFVEGLALLSIAERVGIQSKHEYELCPAESRTAASEPFAGNLLPTI